jgi:hypothetical protein
MSDKRKKLETLERLTKLLPHSVEALPEIGREAASAISAALVLDLPPGRGAVPIRIAAWGTCGRDDQVGRGHSWAKRPGPVGRNDRRGSSPRFH